MKIKKIIAVVMCVVFAFCAVLLAYNAWRLHKIDVLKEQNEQIVNRIAGYMTEPVFEVDENGDIHIYPSYTGGGMKEICDNPISNNPEISCLIEIYLLNEHQIYRLKANKF